ncbi:MAG: hypothetical protein LBQ50_12105, partial [Planctomycetaceae bacterium]|jgi:hypothetical protein|nr:hypothetical protein [Planctomycetaceae bacterium]
LIDPNQPLIDPNQLVIDPNQPLIDPTQPLIELNQPLIELNQPLIELNQSLIEFNQTLPDIPNECPKLINNLKKGKNFMSNKTGTRSSCPPTRPEHGHPARPPDRNAGILPALGVPFFPIRCTRHRVRTGCPRSGWGNHLEKISPITFHYKQRQTQ